MNEEPIVEIFCDGNENIGFGHIRRSSALAAYLEKENVPVRLIGLSEAASKIIPKSLATGYKAKIAVFDTLVGIDDQIAKAKAENKITVTLDWFGKTIPDVNIVVYPHSQVRAAKESYVGFEYIIIRDEMVTLDRNPSSVRCNKVMICLGGGDLLGQSFEVADLLYNHGFDVTLVQGPLARKKTGNTRFPLMVNPSNFPELLNSCDWAVTNGGGCFFEALYLGKPAFVLPQTDLEWKIAIFAREHNAILGAGLHNLYGYEPQEFEQTSTCGMKLVDGQGLDRIAAIIKNLL